VVVHSVPSKLFSFSSSALKILKYLLPFLINMASLDRLLQKKGFAILDGGFATCLEENHGITMHRKLWSAHASLTHPSEVVQAHLDYLGAISCASGPENFPREATK
jgi:hypothetical protein